MLRLSCSNVARQVPSRSPDGLRTSVDLTAQIEGSAKTPEGPDPSHERPSSDDELGASGGSGPEEGANTETSQRSTLADNSGGQLDRSTVGFNHGHSAL